MSAAAPRPAPAPEDRQASTTRKQIRGSSLLLLGKLPTKGINFLVQVLTAHYLTKGDFGAFSYALSLSVMARTLVTFGLDRAVTRFVPIYHEQGEYPRLFGTLLLVVMLMLSISVVAVGTLFVAEDWVRTQLDPGTFGLVFVLVFLAPVQALDETLVGMLAVFGGAKQIFMRRHVLAPLLNLAVILTVMAASLPVMGLAYGMVISATLGVVLYLGVLRRILRDKGVLEHFSRDQIMVPFREILSFTIPLLTTDLLYVSIATMDVVMLGHFHGEGLVADLRVILPLALLNQIVMSSFGVLYTPAAARLFARHDHQGINAYYWQTAVCVAVFSLPVFLLTSACASPVTLLIYGERYAESGILLAILSVGYYFNAALGFNGMTLKVYGRLRYIVAINLGAIVVGFAGNLLLIPRYGAIGAAAATGGTLIVHNLFKQAGLRLGTGIDPFETRYLRVYGWIALAVVATLLPQFLLPVPPAATILMAAVVSLGVVRVTRKELALQDTFPEVARLPFVRRLVA